MLSKSNYSWRGYRRYWINKGQVVMMLCSPHWCSCFRWGFFMFRSSWTYWRGYADGL